MPILDLPEHWVLELHMPDMKAGYGESAYSVLREIAFYIESGLTLPPDAKAYLVQALTEISEKVPPQKALKLNGRKKKSTDRDRLYLARIICHALSYGGALDHVLHQCADKGLGSYEKLRSAYYKYRDVIEAEEVARREVLDA